MRAAAIQCGLNSVEARWGARQANHIGARTGATTFTTIMPATVMIAGVSKRRTIVN